MPLLASLLGNASQSMPDSAGERYNSLLKTGSWVLSGVNEYKKWSDDNFARLKNYMDRYFNFERDPQKALWLVNMLMRKNPVRIPDYMSSDEWSGLQKLWNEWVRGRDQGLGDGPSAKDRDKVYAIPEHDFGNPEGESNAPVIKDKGNPYNSGTITTDKLKGTEPFSRMGDLDRSYISGDQMDEAIYYSKFTSAYGTETIKGNNPTEVVQSVVENLKVSIGYKNYYGFELGSDHSWDIKLKPYLPQKLRGTNNTDWSKVPELPKYKLPKGLVSRKDDTPSSEWFSFGDNCPCLQYNIQFGNQVTKDIKLYNGSQFMIPLGFSYNINIGLDILDDIHGSMKAYMNKYLNSIYDLQTASVARYDQAAFEIDLVVFKPGYIPKVMFGFIAVPINYTPVYDGQNSPNEETIHIDFSVIGMIKMNESTEINTSEKASDDWKGTKWTQVTLSANTTR